MPAGWQVGDTIENRWEVCRVLAGGGAVLYVVVDRHVGAPFVIKTLGVQVQSQWPRMVERFSQAALSWASVSVHQNVVRASMVRQIGGFPCLFVEYVSSGTLDGWIGTPRLRGKLAQVLLFGIQVCDGMSHALAQGIAAHGKLRPGNCLLTRDGCLRVTDFGLPPALDGAPGPDEVEHARDARSDVYDFGVLLCQMLGGPFPDVRRIHEALEPIAQLRAAGCLSPEQEALATLIHTCLDPDPARRFASFRGVRKRLAEIYERHSGQRAPQPLGGARLEACLWNERGAGLESLGRPQDALRCYEMALELDPSAETARLVHGELLRKLGRQAGAAAPGRSVPPELRASGRPSAAPEAAVRAGTADAGPRAREWSQRGLDLGCQGRYEEALACFERALRLDPVAEKAWFNKGVALGALGRFDEALACYERAVATDPYDDRAWSNRGNALGKLGRHQESLACYDRALRLDERDATTWFNKAVALTTLDRHPEALACYRGALRIDAGHAKAWLNMGNTWRRLDDAQKALACYRQAERLGHPRAAEAAAACRAPAEGALLRAT